MLWHLDGWDADGGRAFASLRPENAELLDHDQSWGPMVFIGPPSFRPEPIANTSIALAASRGATFQPRTPAEGRELAFPNADAVADFVRRTFTSRGAPRGGGEGAPNVEGGPREPPVGGDGEAFQYNEFLAPWAAARERLAKADDPTAEEVKTSGTIAPYNERGFQWPAVESGALQLVATMASTFPGTDDVAAFDRWYSGALNLHRAVEALGLWKSWKRGESLLDLGMNWNLHGITKDILQKHTHRFPFFPSHINTPFFLALLFSQYPTFPAKAGRVTPDYLERLAAISGGVSSAAPADSTHMDNRLDALYSLPLPNYARNPVILRNVGELLIRFVSSPDLFVKAHPRLIDLVAFAAALLAANSVDRSLEGWRERAAENWLAGSMPRWAFRDDAEQLIRAPVAVKQMAYA
jgi:hypothetical protein